ncbi:hypothetical protein HanIR_Chr07g0314361 [Helianthus annuus]|nr:hypothetical protein HanIR_Chr07g0314361 [Helianthus annuus]
MNPVSFPATSRNSAKLLRLRRYGCTKQQLVVFGLFPTRSSNSGRLRGNSGDV